MAEFFFIVKSFIFACALLWVMQLKVGTESLEQKTQTFIESSKAVNEVRDIAGAAVQVSQIGIDKVREWLTQQSSELKVQSEKRASK